MIAAPQKAGPIAGFVLSLVFAFLLVLTATVDLFVIGKLPQDRPLPVNVRIPGMALYTDTITGGTSFQFVRVLHRRGVRLSEAEQRQLQAYEAQRRPPSPAFLAGLGAALFLVLLLYTSQLRILPPAALFRTQLVLLLSLLVLAVAAKAHLTATPWSAMWIPLAALTIPCAAHLGARVATATAVAGSLILSLLIPIDVPMLAVLCTQGLAGGLVAGRKGRRWIPVGGGLASALSAGLGFAGVSLLLQQFIPSLDLLRQPNTVLSWLQSDLAGSIGGGLLAGLFSTVTLPMMGRLLGVVSKPRLLELANFESPLLRQIATQTPGTWAHTLSMANMAEMAANAIGADALLVRTGAYYHDLGKTVQPEYFIENQQGQNPHDALPPDVSADAIFAHITEGVKLARRHKVPEAVVEFIYTHHGDGLLEYFWHKNMQQGNPKQLGERDFRYPGCRPQRPETAILAICDAVEAASRTLSEPDLDRIKQLVRQIVFTKLEQGGLNDSGLTVQDLERVINSLVETLRSNFHVRVKYPWQRDDETQRGTRQDPSKVAIPAGPAPTSSSAPASEVIPLQPAVRATRERREDATPNRIGETRERSRVTTIPLTSRSTPDAKNPPRPDNK